MKHLLALLVPVTALRGAARRPLRAPTSRNVVEGSVVSRLLDLEAERRALESKLAANKERQRALALGDDVEAFPPRAAAGGDACGGAGSVWDEACDVDAADPSRPAAAAASREFGVEETAEEFFAGAASRGSWLVGLLAAQSLSSVVLEQNEGVIQRHPVIVFFLTMLVGAGGNAGNQAAVRIIRGLAVGAVVPGTNAGRFVAREAKMAAVLATALSAVGYVRVVAFSAFSANPSTPAEALAVALSLFLIVFLSIVAGAALPVLLERLGAGASNAATTIQVVMDVSGVFITCAVCAALLDGRLAYLLDSLPA